MTKRPVLLIVSVLLASPAARAMGRRPANQQPAEPQKVSTFGSDNPDESDLSQRAPSLPAERGGGDGTSGSGTDTEVGAVGNDAAVHGANTGPTRVMGTGGVETYRPSGEPGLPADPVAPPDNNQRR